MVESKRALRRQMKQRRESLGAKERANRSRQVSHQVLQYLSIKSASCVGLYASKGTEVETDSLFTCLSKHSKIVYPRVNTQTNNLDFIKVNTLKSLKIGVFNVREPAGKSFPLDGIDYLLVPGLAFDLQGGRLGYGGGYYDRALCRFSGLIYGLAFDLQVVDALPLDAHDRVLDGLFTESGILDFRQRDFSEETLT